MQNKYLVLFYTEGPPFDNGYNLSSTVSGIQKKLSQYFDKIFIFNKRSLKQLEGSETVCNEYDQILHPLHNKNANKIGFFDFKPFLISHVLKEIPEDSILLYNDSNFNKYPQYWNTDWKNFEKYLENDIFISTETGQLKVKNNVKKHTLQKILQKEELVNEILERDLFAASKILMKNTSFSRSFINEWHNLCQDKSLILENDKIKHLHFKWNCGDQDVLNCLIYKYMYSGLLPINFPKIHFKNRTWNDSNISLIKNF